jgi:DNA polymerase-3 subunit delta
MFYVLHGDEEFTRSEEIARLKSLVAQEGMGDLNIITLDGRKTTLGELRDACNTLPFLSDKRLVIVEGLLQRWGSKGRARKGKTAGATTDAEEDPISTLIEYLPKMPPSTRLLFIESGALPRSHPLLAYAKDNPAGYVREFQAPSDAQLNVWVVKRAKDKGVSIARDAAGVLVTFVGSNLRLLDQELEKLAGYAGYARPITAQDVRTLVSAAHDDDIFAFVDALGARNKARAIQNLHELLDGGSNELYLLTMIARQFRLILAAKDCQMRGLKPAEIQRTLHISHSFVVDKLLQQGRSFAVQELERIMARILELDQAIKTGRIQGALAVELLVVEIAGLSGRAADA